MTLELMCQYPRLDCSITVASGLGKFGFANKKPLRPFRNSTLQVGATYQSTAQGTFGITIRATF
jgi:hypothetical protein